MYKLTNCYIYTADGFIRAQILAHTHQVLHSHTHIQSRCAMTQRGAAGVKAPVAMVSCHHLEEYMSPCLFSQRHKSPPNYWVSEDQHVSLCHLFFFTHVYAQYARIQHPQTWRFARLYRAAVASTVCHCFLSEWTVQRSDQRGFDQALTARLI